MSRDEVRAAVARRVERTVSQGAIQLRGRRWTCEELWQYSHDKVLVCEPVYHTPAELLLLDMKGNRPRDRNPRYCSATIWVRDRSHLDCRAARYRTSSA
ncbi:hypothetical protein D3227_28580 [Mesorhizobium waimense]|uniref:Transposase-like Mu C-terminal domain-containing protein n=1 Tax=Mesorhizobium waimense TaxID=1300307 RepID=A0A3A5KKB9_9HYPH|nr:hypothetical protein D3227_28580 [Mesorhizobium waimense]